MEIYLVYKETGSKFWIYYLGLDDTREYPKLVIIGQMALKQHF